MTILASADTGVLAALSAGSLLIGYALLWAIWRFVFSARNEHDDTHDQARRTER